MSGSAVAALQKSISQLAKDMAAIEASTKNIAKNLTSASSAAGGFGGQKVGVSFTTAGAGAGGTGAPLAAGNAGAITGQPGTMNRPGLGRQLGIAGLQTIGNIGIGLFNDLRPTAEQATNWEWMSRRARFGGVGYGEFNANVLGGINRYNIMNPDIYLGDVAEALHMGMGASMGIGGTGGLSAGALLASKNVGSFHTLAAMGGLDASTVGGAMRGVYGAQAYYRSMAGGVMTRSSTGRQRSIEEIVNDYAKRYSGSEEELALAFEYGSIGRYELESSFGAEGAEYIISGLMERSRLGRDLNADELEQQMKATGAAGSPATQGLDTRSRLHGAQLGVQAEYRQDVTSGVALANNAMARLNEELAGLEDGFRDVAGAAAAAGGAMDALATSMPSTTSAVTNGLGGMLGILTGAALGRGMGGVGGGGGGGAGGRSSGFGSLLRYGSSRTGAPMAGSLPLTRSMGARVLGGVVGRGIPAIGVGAANMAYWQSNTSAQSDWSALDTAATIGTAAGTGALIGSMFAPGVGTLIGAGIGGLVGIGQSLWSESRDLEQRGGRSGSPGFAEGKWIVEQDQNANIHQGEMILPSRIAQAVRDEADRMRRPSGTNVIINLTVQSASDSEAIRFASRVKRIIDEDQELMTAGEGMLR